MAFLNLITVFFYENDFLKMKENNYNYFLKDF